MRPASTNRFSVRASGAISAGAVLVMAAVVAVWLTGQQRERDAGAALYEGRRPLPARVNEQAWRLPAEAARCVNCHEGAQAIGPPLHVRGLAHPQARRGGPPSRYDARALCRLLRDGVDPAHVLVPQSMPRYEIDDRSCEALWSYLQSR